MPTRAAVERLTRELQALRQQVAEQSKRVATSRSAEARATEAARRASTATTRASREREARRHADTALAAERKRADLEQRSAKKERDLTTAQTALVRSGEREQEVTERRHRSDLAALESRLRTATAEGREEGRRAVRTLVADAPKAPDRRYDVFISHASEDDEEIARPLRDELERLGVRTWYDGAVLRVGDSLVERIEEGLRSSRFGVVVLSKHFFSKRWPQAELRSLRARQEGDGAVRILPIWHGISFDDVAREAPLLIDTVALKTALQGVGDIAAEIAGVVTAAPPSPQEGPAEDLAAGVEFGTLRGRVSVQPGAFDWPDPDIARSFYGSDGDPA